MTRRRACQRFVNAIGGSSLCTRVSNKTRGRERACTSTVVIPSVFAAARFFTLSSKNAVRAGSMPAMPMTSSNACRGGVERRQLKLKGVEGGD
eukprot:26747-Pelagococcus_subviridis.AAC.3